MGRNVVSQGAPSFAGLMDHLTGFSREDAFGSDAGSDFGATFRRTSKPESPANDGSLTNPRNGARTMAPVTERKPGRGAFQQDAAALSYEQALRIHGRRRSPPAVPVGRTGTGAPSRQAGAAPHEDAAATVRNAASNGKPAAIQSRTPTAPVKSDTSASRNGAKATPRAVRNGKPDGATPIHSAIGHPQTPTNLRVASAPIPAPGTSSGNPVKASVPVAAGRRRVAPASLPKAAAKTQGSSSHHSADEPDHSKSQGKVKSPGRPHREDSREGSNADFPQEILSASATGRSALRGKVPPLDPPVGAMEVESAGSQLELLHELGQLDQRRTIVSVRLTEGEFACLRDRAEESGISVSAYMRSCVVDADQLRTQVKRALAEMRSLSTTGSEPGIALTTSGNLIGDASTRNSTGWFRLVMRPLTFLFGPLFPARRSA